MAAGIDVAAVMRISDRAKPGSPGAAAAEYRNLEHKAEDCMECGDCMERCPFGVNVMGAMQEGAALFTGTSAG